MCYIFGKNFYWHENTYRRHNHNVQADELCVTATLDQSSQHLKAHIRLLFRHYHYQGWSLS